MGEAAGGEAAGGRQSTPDILRDNNTKRPQTELEQEKAEQAQKEEEEKEAVKEASPLPVPKEATPEVASKEGSQEVEEVPNNEEVREKKIITSEEEAKVSFFLNIFLQKHHWPSLSGPDRREAAGDEGAKGERG